MTSLAWLIPAALFLGFLGVIAFMWALRSGQFEDLDGAAYRILEDDSPETRDTDDAPGDHEASSGASEHGRDQGN
jgi:cbb3-type cytochrome oxidase maturation protein